MKKLTKKSQLFLYGCSGFGVNLLNTIVGSYLCSALLTGGFVEHVESWTYLNRDLVVASLWAVLGFIAKAIDGVIDLPMSSFTDNLKTKWGKRRPALVIGWVPMVIAYVLFLFPLKSEASVLNTVWFAFLLCAFYSFYTLTMVTYYATFAEIVDNDRDRVYLSNVKSVCDVIYFCVGFALVPVFVNGGLNIRIVALIFLPLALTMMIPLFLCREDPTNTPEAKLEKVQPVNLFKSIAHSFKNRDFLVWMAVHCVLVNIGLQLFLSGINEFFSTESLNMTFIMASSFAPVPFTIMLYNKIVKKRGLGFGYRYVLLLFALGMGSMCLCNLIPEGSDTLKLIVAIISGIIVSFAIGSFFSVGYTVPAQIAADDNARTGIMSSSMLFAVQGLFEGISAAFASYVILVFIKNHDGKLAEGASLTSHFAAWIPLLVVIFTLAGFALTFILPKSITELGKESSEAK